MRIFHATYEEHEWLWARTGCALSPTFRALAAKRDDGTIVAMIGFDGWTPASAQMHIALAHPSALRFIIGPAFTYLFGEVGKRLALGIIPADNRASIRLAKSAGFRETYRVRDGWREDVDLVVLEMRRTECRWVSPVIRKVA